MPPILNTDRQSIQRGLTPRRKVRLAAILATLTAGTLILSGCGESEPEYYETKDVQTPSSAQPVLTTAPVSQDPAAAGPGFSFAMPEGWSQQQPSSMIILAFQAGNPPEQVADVQVSAFPGDVGGQLANLNRWRRQVGLGPVDPEAASGFITAVEVSGIEAWQVDLTGPAGVTPDGSARRMVVSAVPHDGQTWFFKLVGAESAVESQKEQYAAFLQSIQF